MTNIENTSLVKPSTISFLDHGCKLHTTHRIFINQINSRIFGLTKQPLMSNAKKLLEIFYFSFGLTPSTNIMLKSRRCIDAITIHWDQAHMECNVFMAR